MLYVAAMPSDNDPHAAAWTLLKYMLSSVYPDFSEEKALKTENGKPYLAEGAITFSLSHSKGAVAAAVCSKTPISIEAALPKEAQLFKKRVRFGETGVDIEGHTPRDYQKIASGFFSADECLLLCDAPDKAAAFYSIYTRREALSKASGRGISELRLMPSTLNLKNVFTFDLKFGDQSFSLSAAVIEK